jgi:hypothetical protein
MTEAPQDDWQTLCQQESIDPAEVRLVFERYDAYRTYTEKATGNAISLEQWFRFYHAEKSTDGGESEVVPSGCSADGDAVNNACLSRPAEFLKVLAAYCSSAD